MSEKYKINFEGWEVEVEQDHLAAQRLIEAANIAAPKIPEGKNTVIFHFKNAAGQCCAGVNQRNFSPVAKDNEQQVNGLSLLTVEDSSLSKEAGEKILKSLIEDMLEI